MSYTIEKLPLPKAHQIHGQDFPAAFKVTGKASTNFEELLEYIKVLAEKGFFKKQLSLHGAIVIRGLGYTDSQSISKIIETIGYGSGEKPFQQAGSTAKRTKLSGVLTTANESSPSLYIDQHNEFSRFIKHPSTLFFVCSAKTAQGGESPLTNGAELFDSLYKDDKENTLELAREGFLLKQTWPFKTPNNTSWSDYFCFGRYINKEKDDLATQKKKAEKLLEEYVSKTYQWDDENNLVVDEITDPIRLYTRADGKSFPITFNSIPAYYAEFKDTYDVYKKTSSIKHNNGKNISTAFLDSYLKKSKELAYSHSWEEGDIAIVDNYQVSHGRAPWSNGQRTLLVSMWDDPDKLEIPSWRGSEK